MKKSKRKKAAEGRGGAEAQLPARAPAADPDAAASPGVPWRSPRARTALALGIICLIALFARLSPTRDWLRSSGHMIHSPDSLYHLTRIEHTLRSYPAVPVLDRYEEYPSGSFYESPPLYPLLLATPLKLVSLVRPLDSSDIRAVLAWWGPISGVFGVLSFFAFSGVFLVTLRGRLLATLLYALVPIAINYSSYGNVDYQAWIVGWTLLLYRFVLRRQLWPAIAALAVLFGTWQASVFQCGLLVLWALAVALVRKDFQVFEMLARVFLGAAALLTPAVAYVWIHGVREVRPAWFGVGTLLMLLALGTLCLAGARRSPLWLAVSVAAAAPIAHVLWLGVVTLYKNPIPFLSTVKESEPLLLLGGSFSLRSAMLLLTPLVLATPFVAFLLWRKWRAEREGLRAERLFVLVGYCVTGSAGLAQARHSEQWAPFVILVLMLLWETLPKGRWLMTAVLAINIFPVYGATRPQQMRLDYQALAPSLAFWRQTPPTSGWGDPHVQPEYGVLADWEYGLFLEHYARRPSLIDARGPMSTPDWAWVARLLLAEDENIAYDLARERRVRYLLVRDFYGMFQMYPPWIGQRRQEYIGEDSRGSYPQARLFRTVGFRLAEFLGAPGEGLTGDPTPALSHFRLVWLSEAPPPSEGHRYPWWFKVYEVVPGCRIRLSAPGALTGVLTLPNGATLFYEAASTPDREEHVITVPYPSTSFANLEVVSGSQRHVPIFDEAMVRSGAEVDLRGSGDEAAAQTLRSRPTTRISGK